MTSYNFKLIIVSHSTPLNATVFNCHSILSFFSIFNFVPKFGFKRNDTNSLFFCRKVGSQNILRNYSSCLSLQVKQRQQRHRAQLQMKTEQPVATHSFHFLAPFRVSPRGRLIASTLFTAHPTQNGWYPSLTRIWM